MVCSFPRYFGRHYGAFLLRESILYQTLFLQISCNSVWLSRILYCNVFRDRELVNYFTDGLFPATRDAFTERVRNLNRIELGDLTVARRIAIAEGNTYRARVMASTPTTPSKTRPRSSTLFTGEPEASPNPNPFRRDPDRPHLFAGPD